MNTRNKKTLSIRPYLIAFPALLLISYNVINRKEQPTNNDQDIILVKNTNGPTLGYSSQSGIKILVIDGRSFKDLNKNGKLDKYEDWRLPVDVRANDLASKMSIEQIAGLMLYSAHQAIPALPGPMGRATYNGKSFRKVGQMPGIFLTSKNLFLLKII